MGEDILTTAIRIANEAGLGVLWTLGLILAAAVLIVVGKKVRWKAPEIPPDPELSPPIPTSNPVVPPDPGPM